MPGAVHDAQGGVALEQRLADLERPRAHQLPPPRPVHGPRRLYHHPLPHRLMPDRAAIPVARAAASAEWRLAHGRRHEAIVRARLLLGVAASRGEQLRFARHAVREMSIRREIEWRPWTAHSVELDGLEHLEVARRHHRGVILASLHLGPFMTLPLALAYRGYRPYVSGGVPLDEQPVDACTRKLNVDFERLGGRWVRLGGSFPLLQTLLLRGEICHLMLDAPSGRIRAMLAGQPVRLAGGIASLALATGAAIVPAYAVHTQGHLRVVFEAALEPLPGEDEAEVTARLALRLDPALRTHLEQWRPPLEVLMPESRSAKLC